MGSRVPSVRHDLGISAARLGMLLLVLALGGLIVLPFSGRVVARFGSRRIVVVGTSLMAAGLLVVGLGLPAGPAVVAIGSDCSSRVRGIRRGISR